MNLNRIMLAGRLTRDPEIKHTTSGTPIADFAIAVSRFWKSDSGERMEETDFIDITAYGTTASVIAEHLKKGRAVYVEGRLKLDQWDDKQTGAKRSRLKCIAESMQFVGPKPQTSEPAPPQPSKALVEQREQREAAARHAPHQAAQRPKDPDIDSEPDNIPF